MDAAASRRTAFRSSTVLSAIALLCIGASLLAAVPDSATLTREFGWAVASGPDATQYTGLSAFLRSTGAGESLVAFRTVGCTECLATAKRVVLSLLAAAVGSMASLHATRARSAGVTDSAAAKRLGMAAGAASTVALALAVVLFTRHFEAPTALEGSAGPGQHLALIATLAQAVVTLTHALTPVYCSPLARKFIARQDQQHAIRMPTAVGARAGTGSDYDPSDMAGVTELFPGFWDPWKLSGRTRLQSDPAGSVPFGAQDRIRWFREAEVKHGRICMLAALGLLVGENYHPLFGGNLDFPAVNTGDIHELDAFWGPVLSIIFLIEIYTASRSSKKGVLWQLRDDYVNGDLGWDPLNLKPSDPAEFKEVQTKELNNGRLAMLGFAGMLAQEKVDGQKIFRDTMSALNDSNLKYKDIPFTGGADLNPAVRAAGAADLSDVDPYHLQALAKEMAEVLNVTFVGNASH